LEPVAHAKHKMYGWKEQEKWDTGRKNRGMDAGGGGKRNEGEDGGKKQFQR